jgi:hypothetical protein
MTSGYEWLSSFRRTVQKLLCWKDVFSSLIFLITKNKKVDSISKVIIKVSAQGCSFWDKIWAEFFKGVCKEIREPKLEAQKNFLSKDF